MTEMRKPKAQNPKAAAGGGSGESTALLTEMLVTRAHTLHGMFAELVGHAANSFPHHPLLGERYVRLALRAQSNCRASLVTIAKVQRARRRARDAAAE